MGRVVLSILMMAPFAGLALAQDTTDDARFRQIEAGFDDLSPNAAGNRLMPVDFRSPMGFERVYEIVGSSHLLARRAGAVTAVFDRSVYAGDATPSVPPGTVFYLGSLPVDLGAPGLFAQARRRLAPGSAWSRDQADGRAAPTTLGAHQPLDLRLDAAREPESGPPPTGPARSMWTSEAYRQQRVGELLSGVEWRLREWQARRADEAEASGG